MAYQPLQDPGHLPRTAYSGGAGPAPSTARLEGEARADIAIVGAGFTGLSAALHLAEAGVDVAVLEAKEVGWGASGRAFGQVVPYLQDRPSAEIMRHYGPERGPRVIDAVAAGPDLVFELIARHGIECWAVRTGLIFAAHAPAGPTRPGSAHRLLAGPRRAGGDAGGCATAPRRWGRRCTRRPRWTGAAATSIRSPMRAGWRARRWRPGR